MFNSVSATWRVPTATAHAPNEAEYSSTWVGIGEGAWTQPATAAEEVQLVDVNTSAVVATLSGSR